jgi:hypothetical protein
MSEDLRGNFLSLLLSDPIDVATLKKLRTQLLEASAVSQIDAALRRLALTEEETKK